MSFLVVCAGHSGSKFLATQLNQAPGWQVEHEVDMHVMPRFVNHRFAQKTNYGEVNSWLLPSAPLIEADIIAVLLRNPYELCRSILRESHISDSPAAVEVYVREAIAMLHCLAQRGAPIILFREITTSRDALEHAGQLVGIRNLDISRMDLSPINQHPGRERTLVHDPHVVEEFEHFIRMYDL